MTNYLLDGDDLKGISSFLRSKQWTAPDEKVLSARKPGEGNMNYTLRIRTSFRTFILKQSREYVEKYPSIPAPRERAVIEGKFYELIQLIPELREVTPEVAFMDEENSILMLEDLGDSTDFSKLYQAGKDLQEEEVIALMKFLSSLHHKITKGDSSFDFSNEKMRALNAEHIFTYPFLVDNGFDLDTVTPGLQAISLEYKQDERLLKEVAQLSEIYLGEGDQLLHGDYYPGSWLHTLEGVKVIDPEFCFWGPAEFDLSVVMAHSYMANLADQTRKRIVTHYHTPEGFSWDLTEKLAGVEILRRIIGLAQLPLTLDLEAKARLLAQARNMVLSPGSFAAI